MFVLFTHENGQRYFLHFKNYKSAHHFADCLRYCNHIYESKLELFSHIKVKNNNISLSKLSTCPIFYRDNVYDWIQRGYIL